MILLPIDEVKPGMSLATSLRVSRGKKDLVVVTPKHALTEKDISILKDSYGVMYLWVNSSEASDLRSMINDKFEEQHHGMMGSLVDDLMNAQSNFAAKSKDKSESLYQASKYNHAVEGLLESFIGDQKKLSLLTAINSSGVSKQGNMISEDMSSHLGRYCSNVASLAAALASTLKNRIMLHKKKTFRQMKYKASGGLMVFNVYEDMKAIALAGLFCDVGFTTDKYSDIINRRGNWTPEEKKLAQGHLKDGVEIMKEAGAPPMVLATILQSHQSYDGTGYPNLVTTTEKTTRPRSRQEIHLYARILNIVCDYVEMVTYQKLTPVRALYKMRTDLASKYDPELKQAFDRIMMPFPIGEKVFLNNGMECVVVDFHPENPCRPTVNILASPNERCRELLGHDVNLSDEKFKGLIVVKYRGENVTDCLFEMGRFEKTFINDLSTLKDMRKTEAGKVEKVFLLGMFSPTDPGMEQHSFRGVGSNLSERNVRITGDIPEEIERGHLGDLLLLWVTENKQVILSQKVTGCVSELIEENGKKSLELRFNLSEAFDLNRARDLLKNGFRQYGEVVLKKEMSKVAGRVMEPFYKALADTFSVRTPLELEKQPTTSKKKDEPLYPEVVTTLAMDGHVKGTVALSMPGTTLNSIASYVSGETKKADDSKKREVLVDLANFFAGILIQELGRECVVVQVQMPRAKIGDKGSVNQISAGESSFTIKIASGAGPMALEVMFEINEQ